MTFFGLIGGQDEYELTVGKAFGPSELCFNALNFVIQA